VTSRVRTTAGIDWIEPLTFELAHHFAPWRRRPPDQTLAGVPNPNGSPFRSKRERERTSEPRHEWRSELGIYPLASSADQKLSLRALIALVIGSMIGSGIFVLPSAFGRSTGGLGALIAWCIAGGGMLMLAFVCQTLSRRKPELDAGIYA
jgi:hypothetical protein